MLYAALIALVAGGDQWLKYKVEAQDGETFPRPLEKAKGKIWIYRNHNEGFPFGFMEKHKELVRLGERAYPGENSYFSGYWRLIEQSV